jgi:hypothetical protein
MALKFGCEVGTAAMQAGLTTRRLIFRKIFSSTMHFLARRNVTFVFFDYSTLLVNVDDSRLSMTTQQHWMAEAPLQCLGNHNMVDHLKYLKVE